MRIVPQVYTLSSDATRASVLTLCATTNRACFEKVISLQEASVGSKGIYRLFA